MTAEKLGLTTYAKSEQRNKSTLDDCQSNHEKSQNPKSISQKSKTESLKGKKKEAKEVQEECKDESFTMFSKDEKDETFDTILKQLDKTELFPQMRLQTASSEMVEDKNKLAQKTDKTITDEANSSVATSRKQKKRKASIKKLMTE